MITTRAMPALLPAHHRRVAEATIKNDFADPLLPWYRHQGGGAIRGYRFLVLSDGQRELQKNAHDFAEAVLLPVVDRIDRASDGWESFLAGREAYREMARAGFTKSFIPAGYGGAGCRWPTTSCRPRTARCVSSPAEQWFGHQR
jgi:alkylation response protein AidB-like acyl-CoA dehydrogenase